MGYSIYTTARSQSLIKQARKLFDPHLNRLSLQSAHLAIGKDLAYHREPISNLYIGFNYSGSGHWIAWQYAALLALTIGRKRRFVSLSDANYPKGKLCHYILYDSELSIPLLHERPVLNHRVDFVIVDKYGVLDLSKDRYSRLQYGEQLKIEARISREIYGHLVPEKQKIQQH